MQILVICTVIPLILTNINHLDQYYFIRRANLVITISYLQIYKTQRKLLEIINNEIKGAYTVGYIKNRCVYLIRVCFIYLVLS